MNQWILVLTMVAYGNPSNDELSVAPSLGPTFSSHKSCLDAAAAISKSFPAMPVKKDDKSFPPRLFSKFDCVEIPR